MLKNILSHHRGAEKADKKTRRPLRLCGAITGQRQEESLGLYLMGARWVDPALSRWLSADTFVPNSNHLQDYNRYSYVHNQPLRYTDPSGHCAGTPGNGQDDECWSAYLQIAGILDGDFNFLAQWGLSELSHLLDWLNKGIRLGSNSTWAGDRWTAANVRDVVAALDRVQSVLGDKTMAALGLGDGAELSFIKKEAGCSDPGCIGGGYYADRNRIELFLSAASAERAIEVAIHEMGHAVDWHGGGGAWWSQNSDAWLGATGWRRHYEYGHFYVADSGAWLQGVRDYSRTNMQEDFADTFTWYVESGFGGYSEATGRPSFERQVALNVALGEFR